MARRRERRYYIREAWVQAESRRLLGLLKGLGGEFPVINLSRRGICFHAADEPKKGTPMTLLIDVPADNMPFALIGQVAWTKRLRGLKRRFAVGLEFNDVDAATDGRLVQLLADPLKRMQGRPAGRRSA